MLPVALILIALAAAIHLYVFVLESLRWTRPRTRAVFGVRTAQEAETMRLLAFNQGFYNLFLAIVAAAGVAFTAAGATAPGAALLVAGAGSMVGAGVVLIASDPRLLRAALVQALPPGLGLVALGIHALR